MCDGCGQSDAAVRSQPVYGCRVPRRADSRGRARPPGMRAQARLSAGLRVCGSRGGDAGDARRAGWWRKAGGGDWSDCAIYEIRTQRLRGAALVSEGGSVDPRSVHVDARSLIGLAGRVPSWRGAGWGAKGWIWPDWVKLPAASEGSLPAVLRSGAAARWLVSLRCRRRPPSLPVPRCVFARHHQSGQAASRPASACAPTRQLASSFASQDTHPPMPPTHHPAARHQPARPRCAQPATLHHHPPRSTQACRQPIQAVQATGHSVHSCHSGNSCIHRRPSIQRRQPAQLYPSTPRSIDSLSLSILHPPIHPSDQRPAYPPSTTHPSFSPPPPSHSHSVHSAW